MELQVTQIGIPKVLRMDEGTNGDDPLLDLHFAKATQVKYRLCTFHSEVQNIWSETRLYIYKNTLKICSSVGTLHPRFNLFIGGDGGGG